jgi:hypothetical protein
MTDPLASLRGLADVLPPSSLRAGAKWRLPTAPATPASPPSVRTPKARLPRRKDSTPSTDLPTPADDKDMTVLQKVLWYRRQEMILAARSNSFRSSHRVDKGTSNELIVVEFLESTLCTSRIGVGSGEVLSHARDGSRGQNDIILYDSAMPVLTGGRYYGPTLFFQEGVLAVVEVKTSLSNADLQGQVSEAARRLSSAYVLVLAFGSQVTLDGVDVAGLGSNVVGVFILDRGCVVQHEGRWERVPIRAYCPLAAFYVAVSLLMARHVPSGSPSVYRYLPPLPFTRACS